MLMAESNAAFLPVYFCGSCSYPWLQQAVLAAVFLGLVKIKYDVRFSQNCDSSILSISRITIAWYWSAESLKIPRNIENLGIAADYFIAILWKIVI